MKAQRHDKENASGMDHDTVWLSCTRPSVDNKASTTHVISAGASHGVVDSLCCASDGLPSYTNALVNANDLRQWFVPRNKRHTVGGVRRMRITQSGVLLTEGLHNTTATIETALPSAHFTRGAFLRFGGGKNPVGEGGCVSGSRNARPADSINCLISV